MQKCSLKFLCPIRGMATGCADDDAVINTFPPPRSALEEYVAFLD